MTQQAARERLPAAERRRAILETACRVFSDSSYRGATTAEIAREAGISEPILYRHFGSKRDLYLACLDEAWRRLRETAEAAVEQQRGHVSCIGAVAECYMRSEERVRLVDLWIQALTVAPEDEAIATALREQIREVHGWFADKLRASQADGSVDPDRDPVAEAWLFIAGGVLVTIDHRLGGFLGSDIERVKQARKAWLLKTG
ncbi:MAG TPA: TetR/AcrR family transcriptional regulator [Gaiellaceae bacterium]|nr:TetR/AcrR family transcriptional regulator [Gaiellaceae bacterium]